MQVNSQNPILMNTATRLLLALVLSACTAFPALAQTPYFLSTTMFANNCAFGQSVTLAQEIYWGGTGTPTNASSNYALFTPGCGLTITQGGYGPNTLIYLTCTTQCNGMVLTLTETVQFTADPDTIEVAFNFDCSSGAANDECIGAILLNVMETCNGVPGSLVGATQTYPPTNCGGFFGSAANDVWYAFVATGDSAIVQATGDPGVDLVLEVFLDDCSNPASTACSDNTLDGGTEEIWLQTQAGQLYHYRVYEFTSTPSAFGFNTCVFAASIGAPDCEGTPGGSAVPGTPCTTPLNQPGTWSAACICEDAAPFCEACFTTVPLMGDSLPVPFTANFINCSTSGSAPPFTWAWSFPGGVVSTLETPTFTFPGPGQYQVCLDFADADGCTSTICNDINVNAFGGINTIFPNPPDPLIVHVDMTMCDPGTTATISTGAGAQPPYSFTVVLDTACSWLDTLWMTGPSGSVSVTLSCDPMGSTNTQYFDFNLGVVGLGFFYSGCANPVFDCLLIANGPNLPGTPCSAPSGAAGIWSPACVCIENSPVDCEGVAGGTALPGTPCQVPGTILQGIWGADCECVANSNTDCEAGFWVLQAYEVDSLNPGSATPIPYELWVWNLSTGTSPFQFLWSFGDGTTSTDPFPTHVYGNGGPYQLCLTLSDAAGCTSAYCDSISIDGDGLYEGMAPQTGVVRNGFTIRVLNQLPTGIMERAFTEERLWPNPVNESLSLSFRSTVSGIMPLSIIDLNGRVLHNDNLTFTRGDNRIDLGAAHLVPGMYVLRFGNDANTMNIRFVKL
jgi:PKD repeat protein